MKRTLFDKIRTDYYINRSKLAIRLIGQSKLVKVKGANLNSPLIRLGGIKSSACNSMCIYNSLVFFDEVMIPEEDKKHFASWMEKITQTKHFQLNSEAHEAF